MSDELDSIYYDNELVDPAVIESLAAAEKEIVWKRRDAEIAFLLSIPSRASSSLSIALPLLGLLLGTFALAVVPVFAAKEVEFWKIVVLLSLLVLSLFYLVVTIWFAVQSISPTGLDLIRATSTFVEDASPHIEPVKAKASVDRLIAAMARQEYEGNQKHVERRMKTLEKSLRAARNAFFATVVLLLVALYFRATIESNMSNSNQGSGSGIPKPVIPSTQTAETVNRGMDGPARPAPQPPRPQTPPPSTKK